MSRIDLSDLQGLYPIRSVAQITGVNPITLRAWERRHGLIKPLRTEKGHRLYSPQDISNVQRIVHLLDQGMSISQVPDVLHSEPVRESIPSVVEEATASTNSQNSWRDDYEQALAHLQSDALEQLEADALAFTHAKFLLQQHLLPLFDELAVRRMQDSAADAQYHLLHMRLLPLLARHLAQDVPLTAQTFLLVSLPPERGLLPLMRMAFLMRQSGLHAMVRGAGISANTAVYTGQSLGIQNIVLMFDHRPPSAILGTQLPLLAQAGFKLYALGSHVMDLVDELRDLNVTLCAGEPSAALASLREHLHTAHE